MSRCQKGYRFWVGPITTHGFVLYVERAKNNHKERNRQGGTKEERKRNETRKEEEGRRKEDGKVKKDKVFFVLFGATFCTHGYR